ncbi:MAG TPA: MurR/RpiR family transcriptional regulator [Clostridia bacterium]|nr:MurR/RpiR family transcriptional regulator [Clostridia bacterium]
MDIVEQIKEQYSGMNKTRRRIAEFIMEYPEKCGFLSLKDLAEQTGTTQVTLLSFCRDMGYRNYLEFKQELQSGLIAKIEVRDRMKLVHSASRSDSDMYDQLVRSTHQMIDSTYANNSIDTILQFARKLIDAKRVFIASHNLTRKPAQTIANHLAYENIDARCLDIEDKDEVFSVLTAWPPEECLLLAFGISPCGRSTLAIAEFCQSLGMDVISITDKATSQLMRYSSVSIVCSVQTMSLFNSLTTIFLMTDVLTAFVSAELEKRGGGRQKSETTRLRGMFGGYFLD